MRYALLLFTLTVAAVAAAPAAAPQAIDSEVVGVWRGQSICTSSARAACKNETVVYYIDPVAEKPGVVSIRADKIVNGQAVTMGTSDWKHDAEHHTLTWETPVQTWLLKVEGDAMDGTLTLADKTIVRRMTLKREKRER